jgi:hypothetical protein
MISSATVQSAIVLMNRRMKVERGPATAGFVPVCSSVEDMYLHHLGGTRAAQEGSARFEETADPPTPSSTVTGYITGLARLKLRAASLQVVECDSCRGSVRRRTDSSRGESAGIL